MTEKEDEEVPQEFKTEVECPNCGEKLYFIHYRTSISYEEGIEIDTYFCKKCLYKKNSINQLSRGSHIKLVLRVRSSLDLRILVYRSPEAKIEIPEYFADIEPGEASSGEITTVEGILQKLLDRLELFDSEDADPEVISALREKIENAIRGNGEEFTLVVDDPSGMSRINSNRTITVKV
jgi:zinc finger protein